MTPFSVHPLHIEFIFIFQMWLLKIALSFNTFLWTYILYSWPFNQTTNGIRLQMRLVCSGSFYFVTWNHSHWYTVSTEYLQSDDPLKTYCIDKTASFYRNMTSEENYFLQLVESALYMYAWYTNKHKKRALTEDRLFV